MPARSPGRPFRNRVGRSNPSPWISCSSAWGYPMSGMIFRGRLPDLAQLLAHHRIARLAAERAREHRQGGRRTVRAELRQRVRVRVHEELRQLGPDVRRPAARPRQEEALVTGQAVDLRRLRLALERLLVRLVGDAEPAEVRGRLAQNELAVDVL